MNRTSPPPVLALDSGSPTVSVAVARGGRTLAARRVEIGRSSQRLLPLIDEALGEAGVAPGELAGIVALAGPGSFTGLRVGLATAMGLHQALGVPATAVPTLGALAATVPRGDDPGRRRAVAVVDVLRDEWAVGEFTLSEGAPPRARGSAERLPRPELVARLAAMDAEPAWLVGFGVGALEGELADAVAAGRVRPWEPAGLAEETARLATEHPPAWNPKSLTEPLYFRPPAVTPPKKRPGRSPRRG